jgi:type II secretory pathway component HofQ
MARLLFVALGLSLSLGCAAKQSSSKSSPAEGWALDIDSRAAPFEVEEAAVSAPAFEDEDETPADRRHRKAPVLTPCTEKAWPKYRGHTIDIDLKDAELHNVFRLLADVGRVNIVVADDVNGAITLRLRRVPWDQVLDTVVKVKGLKLVHEHGVYRITTR